MTKIEDRVAEIIRERTEHFVGQVQEDATEVILKMVHAVVDSAKETLNLQTTWPQAGDIVVQATPDSINYNITFTGNIPTALRIFLSAVGSHSLRMED